MAGHFKGLRQRWFPNPISPADMQLVRNGPDIPNEILEALEEDRLVLFCGAGLSMPTLPNFRKLVERVYASFHESVETEKTEKTAFNGGQYDRVLDLLERRIGRDKVREAVVTKLSADPGVSLENHKNILELARTPDQTHRLVTTNFDDLFQRAAKANALKLEIDVAPQLPVPKPHRWSSLVHLHGHIDLGSRASVNNLIFTSADFGRAYLTERWASRFVTDLFAHFNFSRSVTFSAFSAAFSALNVPFSASKAETRASSAPNRVISTPVSVSFSGEERGGMSGGRVMETLTHIRPANATEIYILYADILIQPQPAQSPDQTVGVSG